MIAYRGQISGSLCVTKRPVEQLFGSYEFVDMFQQMSHDCGFTACKGYFSSFKQEHIQIGIYRQSEKDS
mgnify:CR=1 FL=1